MVRANAAASDRRHRSLQLLPFDAILVRARVIALFLFWRMGMDKETFFKTLIGEEVEFTVPRFRIAKEAPKQGVVTGADSAFVYIDTEPYSIDLVEIE